MGNRAARSKDVCPQKAKGLVDQTEVCLLSCLGGAIGCPKIRLGF